jgi:hypothetical protein
MKKLFVIFALALLVIGCPNPSTSSPPGGSTPGGNPSAGGTPPVTLTGPVKAVLWSGSELKLWDGTNTVVLKTGASAVKANGFKVAVDKTLYFLDSAGNVTSTAALPAVPAGVVVIGDPVTYDIESLSNAQSQAIDWTPGAHVRIWKDGIEYGDWHVNAFQYASSFEAENGDLICLDAAGAFHDVSNTALVSAQIVSAAPGGPIWYQSNPAAPNFLTVYDAAGAKAWTFSVASMWTEHAEWLKVGSTWYGARGDTFSDATGPGVTSLATVSGGGYFQPPTMKAISAQGTHALFAECNTGSLIDLDTATGKWTVSAQLYAGDGTQDSGIAAAATLTPALIGSTLYYHAAGAIKELSGGTVSTFSTDLAIWPAQ